MSPTSGSFTLFSQLPKEIRLKIWSFSIPDQRIIRLKFNRNLLSSLCGTYNQGWKVHAPTIPGLAATYESREETLKHYQRIDLLPILYKGIGVQFFNYDRDILVFGGKDGYTTLQQWVWLYMFPRDQEYPPFVHSYQACYYGICTQMQHVAFAPPKKLELDMTILSVMTESYVFTNLKKLYAPQCTLTGPWGTVISYVDSREGDPTNTRTKDWFLWGHQRLAERRAQEEERLARLKVERPPATETLIEAVIQAYEDDDDRQNRISVETIRLREPVGVREIDIEFLSPDEMEAVGFGKLSVWHRYPKKVRNSVRDAKSSLRGAGKKVKVFLGNVGSLKKSNGRGWCRI